MNRPLDDGTRRLIVDWLIEEALELQAAEHASGQLDAFFDAAGVLVLGLSLFNGVEREVGLMAWAASQRSRSRKTGKLFRALKALSRGLGDDMREQANIVFLTRQKKMEDEDEGVL